MNKARKTKGGTAEAALKRRLVEACRLLAMAGQGDDVWGHATARVPGTDTFWMKPAGLGLEEIRAEDLQLIDLDGKVLRGPHPRHTEVFIHTEVFRARVDVGRRNYSPEALASRWAYYQRVRLGKSPRS